MEKEKFSFMNEGNHTIPTSWNSSSMMFGMEIQGNEMNCSSEQLPNSFFNPNWENSMDQSDPFESALSSIVSSPANSNAGIPIPGENIVLRELIGRLGSICNSGEISPQSYINSTNTSCYTTPLNSPPKLNLSMVDHQIRGNFPSLSNFPTDPSFADRAARFSSFSGHAESGFLSRVSSNQSFKIAAGSQPIGDGTIPAPDKKFSRLSRPSTPENTDLGDSMEESSVSEQIPGGNIGMKVQNDSNAKKRKSNAKGKAAKEASLTPSAKDLKDARGKEESNAKRSKSDEEDGDEKAKGNGTKKQTKESAKPPEPPKDYIHVRARRGQATDSHSLAERVRREKISERMKFLQDLVPGCNKITGKAVMLDEIINYVQSLQHQVEFLSMKLATVNPSMEVSMEALLSKDAFQSRGPMQNSSNTLNVSAQQLPYAFQAQHNDIPYGTEHHLSSTNPLTSANLRNLTMKLPHLDGFPGSASQASSFWEDDLQSIVQMGLISQNQPQNIHGTTTPGQMKFEQ